MPLSENKKRHKGVNGRFTISAKPELHIMFVTIINGRSDGSALFCHNRSPFFAAENVSFGNMSIIRLKSSAVNAII
jgi:hypothetical protein